MQHVTREELPDHQGPWQVDQGVQARFFTKACLNPRFGKDEGAHRYVNRVYVEKVPQGDWHRSRPTSLATDLDKDRFRDAWQQFERGARGGEVGTPLKEWPYLSSPQILELQDNQVLTVEKLASMPDKTALSLLGPDFRTIQAKAVAWLAGSESEAQKALSDALKEANARINELESRMRHMQTLPRDAQPGDAEPVDFEAKIAAMIEAKLAALVPAKRGPGRPPKEEAA